MHAKRRTSSTRELWIVLPVSGIARGKSRLASALSPIERGQLNRRLVWHALDVMRSALATPGRCIVVSPCARTLLLAKKAGAIALCEWLGKTPVVVPDIPGFVVNRLLFPYLFSAVALQEETGLEAEAIDTCMQLGAGHPMGPLALLDYVGLDVAQAIGEALQTEIPASLLALVAEGALGRKSGRGFYTYG